MIRLPLSAVVLVALGSVACQTTVEKAVPAAKQADSHPAWLVGALEAKSMSDVGDVETHLIDLAADGTATWTDSKTYAGVSYGDRKDVHVHQWSAQGTTLTVGSVVFEMKVSPNCHLFQLDETVFGALEGHREGCPFTPEPLGALEKQVAGSWVAYDSHGRQSLVLTFAEDRAFTIWSIGAGKLPLHATYSITEKGTLHVTMPDGSDVLSQHVELRGGELRLCDRDGCLPFTQDNP